MSNPFIKRCKTTGHDTDMTISKPTQMNEEILCEQLSHNLWVFIYSPPDNPILSLIVMGPDSSLSLNGKCRLIHLLGHPIHIIGATIKADEKTTHVLFSPSSHAPVTVQHAVVGTNYSATTIHLDEMFESSFLHSVSSVFKSKIRDTASRVGTPCSIFTVLPYACRLTDSIVAVKKFRNLFSLNTPGSFPTDMTLTSFLGFSFSPCGSTHEFRVSPEMFQLASQFASLSDSYLKNKAGFTHPPTLLFAGPKGAGKSSLLRFVINNFLTSANAQKEIAVFDCDIGQPEFTTCGMISLTIIRKPLFGPPFVHQLLSEPKPLCQCFVGSVTPSNNPNLYVECMQYVFDRYKSLPDPKPPLLVNTMGWTQGLGLTLLSEQILLVKPHIVAQLQLTMDQPGARLNLPVLDSTALRSMDAWRSRDNMDAEFNHKVIIISSLSGSMSRSGLKFNFGAPDHRDLTLLAYFVSTLSKAPTSLPAHGPDDPLGHPVAHFLDCLPYRVPLICPASGALSSGTMDATPSTASVEQSDDDFRLGVCIIQTRSTVFRNPAELLPFDLETLLKCLNATLVALCAVPSTLIEDSNTTPPFKVIRENPVCDCFGLAICRAVDQSAGVIYLTTGTSEEDLMKVTGILRGSVNLPQCFFLEQPVPMRCTDNPKPVHLPYLGPAETHGPGRISIPARRSYPRTHHHEFHRIGSSETYEDQ